MLVRALQNCVLKAAYVFGRTWQQKFPAAIFINLKFQTKTFRLRHQNSQQRKDTWFIWNTPCLTVDLQ